MRASLLALALLLATSQAEAGPFGKLKDWAYHHPKAARVGLKVAAATASAVVAREGLSRCRAKGVEDCDGKYGASLAIFWSVTAANFLMIPVSEGIGGVEGDVLSFGASGAQLGHGLVEWRKDHTTHVDMSEVRAK